MQELGKIVTNQHGLEKTIYALHPDRVVPEEHTIFTSDKKQIEISWRTNFGRMKEVAESWKEIYPYQDKTTVDLDAIAEYPTLPFLVYIGSDWHIGNVDTDYDKLQHDIELIENTPNTGLITLGDDIDNAILAKYEVRFMQTAPPYVQAFTAEDLMAELNGRNPRHKQLVLAHVIGNHTHTLMEQSGYLFEKFYEKSKAAILPGMGQVFLNYGDQKYENGFAHRFFGKSKLNVTLEGKRLMEYAYPDADTATVGHSHVIGFEEFQKGGKLRLVGRAGTYRVGTDLFEQARGWGHGQIGGLSYLFYPDRKLVQPFRSVDDGVDYLKNLMIVHGLPLDGKNRKV